MIDKLKSTDFSAHLNQTFQIQVDTVGSLRSELVEVTELGSESGNGNARRPFSLIFRAPKEPILPQAIYRVEHKQMGPLDLFLVPVGPDEEGLRYEAVFT